MEMKMEMKMTKRMAMKLLLKMSMKMLNMVIMRMLNLMDKGVPRWCMSCLELHGESPKDGYDDHENKS